MKYKPKIHIMKNISNEITEHLSSIEDTNEKIQILRDLDNSNEDYRLLNMGLENSLSQVNNELLIEIIQELVSSNDLPNTIKEALDENLETKIG